MNPETTADLAQRSWSDPDVVPDDVPPAEHWMGVLGKKPPTSPVADPNLDEVG